MKYATLPHMGWVMMFLGLILPLVIGWLLIVKLRANIWLSLLSLVALPLVLWSASLYLKIGPCGVPDCMTSSEHSRLVLAIPGIVLLAAALVLLAIKQNLAAAGALIVGLLLCAIGVTKTDNTITIALAIICAAAAGYELLVYTNRERPQVPDYPPAA